MSDDHDEYGDISISDAAMDRLQRRRRDSSAPSLVPFPDERSEGVPSDHSDFDRGSSSSEKKSIEAIEASSDHDDDEFQRTLLLEEHEDEIVVDPHSFDSFEQRQAMAVALDQLSGGSEPDPFDNMTDSDAALSATARSWAGIDDHELITPSEQQRSEFEIDRLLVEFSFAQSEHAALFANALSSPRTRALLHPSMVNPIPEKLLTDLMRSASKANRAVPAQSALDDYKAMIQSTVQAHLDCLTSANVQHHNRRRSVGKQRMGLRRDLDELQMHLQALLSSLSTSAMPLMDRLTAVESLVDQAGDQHAGWLALSLRVDKVEQELKALPLAGYAARPLLNEFRWSNTVWMVLQGVVVVLLLFILFLVMFPLEPPFHMRFS